MDLNVRLRADNRLIDLYKSEILLINGVKFERAPDGRYQLYVDHSLFYIYIRCFPADFSCLKLGRAAVPNLDPIYAAITCTNVGCTLT